MNDDRKAAAPTRHVAAAQFKDSIDMNVIDASIEDGLQDDSTRVIAAPKKHVLPQKTLHPGSVIKNRFRLEREIGRGGMGVVYAAHDLVQEEVGEQASLIAIKLLSEDFKSHPDALHMLQQECKKAQSLAHPNIGTVYDFDRDEDNVYMTMELLSGCSLQAYLKERQYQPVPFDKVILMLTDIVAGLNYAHRRNIIHSDLKPANIFLTESGAKILDFGIARAVMNSEAEQTDATSWQRSGEDSAGVSGTEGSAGEIPLTLSYASLEMIQGAPPDVRDDVYGLACITYELLSGQHPYGRRSAQEAFDQRLVPRRLAGLKEWQWNALLRGLALKRQDRTGSATEFMASLLPRRKEPWKWAAFVLAVVAVTSAGYFFLAPSKLVESSLFENPPAAAVMTQAQQQQVDDVLAVAEVHMMVGRLVSPPGGNALDEYRKVLDLNPNNRDAIEGLKTLLNKLVQLAESAIEDGDYRQAAELIGIGLEVHGKHEGLLALRQQVDSVEN